MILDAANICNDIQVLNILSIVKTIIKIITTAVPIVLIIFIILDVIKTISSVDVDNKKLSKSIGKRIIAAVIIFLMPAIIDLVVSNLPFESYYMDCYNKTDNIETIAEGNFNTSRIACEQANEAYFNCSGKCTTEYSDAYVKCEQAKKDAKLIPDKAKRNDAKQKIQAELDRLSRILKSR